LDVAAWLKNLGLGQYEQAFRDNAIDNDILASLTVEDLRDLGVTIVGHRRKLLEAIAALNAALPLAQAAAPPAASPSPPRPPSPRERSADVTAERRPVTVMFCDLVGSTGIAAKLDAEDWRNLVGAYLDTTAKAVTGFGGHVLQTLGDGLIALFGYPRAQENDAERASRAALAILKALDELNARHAGEGLPVLAARIGLDSGPVVVDSLGQAFGEPPNVAARVQGAAEPGTVLVTAAVQRNIAGLFIAEDRGVHDLKGLPAPVTLYRLVRASGGGRRLGARRLAPCVGREEGLALLARSWERARSGDGQLVQIVGEPGIGKSRLIEEFRVRLGETPHSWVEWASSQLLQNTPLHPLAEWGRLRFGGADLAAERRLADLEFALSGVKLDPAENAPLLAPLFDIPLPEGRAPNLAPEELRRRRFATVVAWVMAGARAQPIVLAAEDLQWADPTSLDLLTILAERGAAAALLILASARPEFRAPWARRSHHRTVSLTPLDRAQVQEMVDTIAEGRVLSKELIDKVADRTGGVPLFVQEVTRLLLEGGDQTIPPTLEQSLAARLDRLGDARKIAQVGAVLGREFTYALLRAVAAVDSAPSVDVNGAGDSALDSALGRLTEADLLFVEGAAPEATYRFKHALIQDAAYESLLKSRRHALHGRAAKALAAAPDPQPEPIAYHFTQAGETELAIEWWGKAGDAALRRSAFHEAIAHLGKAIEMVDRRGAASPEASARRLKLHTEYTQAVTWSRGWAADETKAAYERAGDLAARSEAPAARLPALYGQAGMSLLRGDIRAARRAGERLLQEAEAEGRIAEAGVAHRVLGLACVYEGSLAEALSHLQQALDSYDGERDTQIREKFGQDTGVGSRAYLAYALWLSGDGLRPRELIEEAVGLGRQLGHAPSMVNALAYKVILEGARENLENVVADAENLLRTSERHGMKLFDSTARVYLSWARGRMSNGRVGGSDLRLSLAEYRGEGNGAGTPCFLGFLAQLEAAAGDRERALAAIEEGLATAQECGQHVWDAFLYRLRGDILLKRRPADPTPAEQAYRTAIAVAKKQGARAYELIASLALAKLCHATGRPTAARAALAPALEGFSPTLEMPEVAEAQSLMARLA
jgi:class 3 adenylate cyclase/tetratricopeptide (TPR) repeat protein